MNLLIFDSPALCYRAWHKLGGLAFEGQETGIIYGFLTQVYALAKPFGPSWQPVFCWDSRRSLRANLFPGYKVKRRTGADMTEKERAEKVLAYRQFSIIRRRVLPALGFANNFLVDGLESDDLMAALAGNIGTGQAAVVTTDHDMYQILRRNVWIVNPADGKGYTEDRFRDEWGVNPPDWADAKTIAGCATDEVPGVPGVAEKTAIKFLTGGLTKGVKFNAIHAYPTEEYERNRMLVTLPFPGTPVPRLSVGGFDRDGFLMVCDDFNFSSLEPKVDAWAALFGR